MPVRPLLVLLLALAACPRPPAETTSSEAFVYPSAPRLEVVDTLHGTEVPDPYRWLEDPEAPDTRAWIAAQNALTRSWIDAGVGQDTIRARLEHLWNHERYGIPVVRGGRTFYERNDGLQDHAVLLVMDGPQAEPRVLLDPNTLSEDGTVSLAFWAPSEDGRLVAWATSDGGSDWRTVRVRDVRTGEDLPDVLQWVKFSGVSWLPDGSGFFYSRYPETDRPLEAALHHHKLYFHRLGTPQSEDRLIYERPDQPEWGFGGEVTEDGELLVITVWQGTEPRNRVHLLDLRDEGAAVRPLLDDFDARYTFAGRHGGRLYFHTDRDAPRGRVIAVDPGRPEPDHHLEVVPEGAHTLQTAELVGGHLVVQLLEHAHARVRVYTPEGAPVRDVELPGLGSVMGFSGRSDDPITWFWFTGFTTPGTVYRHDLRTGESEVFRAPQVDFDPEAYETRQVFVHSRDGTRVPMFLVHRRGLQVDGDNPTLLTGYGGFNIPLTPYFSVSHLVWLELGGVLAVANLRGGGEYGRDWHQAGTRAQKQNVFDDFIACAEHLVETGITRPGRLAIRGGSNGGLLVGAVLNQRPELFGAAIPKVGVMDMLRYHQFTIGWAWASDYGTADDPELLPVLLGYSPYHNVREGAHYPPVLVTTADRDDRVVPAHSFKYAAALQHAQGGDAPILIRIETRAGHGAGRPTSMIIDETADEWTFLVRALEMRLELP